MNVRVPSPAVSEIRFFHRGAVVRLGNVDPTRSVLDWLREQVRDVARNVALRTREVVRAG